MGTFSRGLHLSVAVRTRRRGLGVKSLPGALLGG